MSAETETNPSTSSVLQLMLDVHEIRQLVARWCRAADRGAGEEVAELFTEDGVFEVAGHDHHSGREKIAAITGATDQLRHVTADSLIDVEGDRASHVSTVMLYRARADRSSVDLVTTGTYNDVLARTPDGWRLARRTVVVDLESSVLRVRAFAG